MLQRTTNPLESLAHEILGGKTLPYGMHRVFGPNEWTDAATYALEEGDWSELEFMEAREQAWDRFSSSAFAERMDWTFDEYCDRYEPEAAFGKAA
jgi:hypothetical protein